MWQCKWFYDERSVDGRERKGDRGVFPQIPRSVKRLAGTA